MSVASQFSAEVAWHDAECGSYAADLQLWDRLAREAAGPVLELGAGTGRVALHLAGRGHEVTAVDEDEEFLEALATRADSRSLAVTTIVADIGDLSPTRPFALVIAPMQVLQLLDRDRRVAALECAAATLAPDGRLAVAIVEEAPELGDGAAAGLLPDVVERDGWIYSSLPTELTRDGDWLVVRRLRQLVSPDGDLSDSVHTLRLAILTPGAIAADARVAGFRTLGDHAIPGTDDHLGSTVVMLELV